MNKARKLDQLVESVEELLAQLPSDASPQIKALRDQVDAGIEQTWNAVARQAADARQAAQTALDSARRASTHPYTVVGAVMLAALLLALRRRN